MDCTGAANSRQWRQFSKLTKRNIDRMCELNLSYNLSCQGESGGGAGGGASASGPSMNSLGGTAPTVLSQLR